MKEFITREDLDKLESSSLLGGSSSPSFSSSLVRQRQRNGSDATHSSRATSSDAEDYDALPVLSNPHVPLMPVTSPSSLPACCFLLSAAGVVFLAIIAIQLRANSLYLQVGSGGGYAGLRKSDLAEGVLGAVYMYAFCAVVAGWAWYRQRSYYPTSGFPRSASGDHLAVD